jgi:hypothetical protein
MSDVGTDDESDRSDSVPAVRSLPFRRALRVREWCRAAPPLHSLQELAQWHAQVSHVLGALSALSCVPLELLQLIAAYTPPPVLLYAQCLARCVSLVPTARPSDPLLNAQLFVPAPAPVAKRSDKGSRRNPDGSRRLTLKQYTEPIASLSAFERHWEKLTAHWLERLTPASASASAAAGHSHSASDTPPRPFQIVSQLALALADAALFDPDPDPACAVAVSATRESHRSCGCIFDDECSCSDESLTSSAVAFVAGAARAAGSGGGGAGAQAAVSFQLRVWTADNGFDSSRYDGM